MNDQYLALQALGQLPLEGDLSDELLTAWVTVTDQLEAPAIPAEIHLLLGAFPATDETCHGVC